MISLFLILVAVLLLPAEAYAWGPATHMEYAHHALTAIALFSPAVKKLLQQYSDHFLYGTVAADITLGKNLKGYLYNCHNWQVALDIYNNRAKHDHQKAFMLGYMGHLAADTVAHNFFVPFKIIRSWKTKLLKHVYWEIRMDLSVDPHHWKSLEHFATNPFTEDDALLEGHLKRTFFSFRTNKKIFNSLLMLQQLDHYKNFVSQVADDPDWVLAPEDILTYKTLAKNALVDFLTHLEKSYCLNADPTGKIRLHYARDVAHDLKDANRMGILTPEIEKQILKDIKLQMKEGLYEPKPLPIVRDYLQVISPRQELVLS